MNGESLNIQQDNLEKLKQLFPDIFSEGKIDMEKFNATFSDNINFSNERYVLNWAGKADAFKALQIPTTATLLAYIQNKTELTRSTILEVLKKSGRINELLLNPQLFMDNATGSIKSVLYELMIDGIKYEKIGNRMYEMQLFEDNELEIYLDQFTHTVNDPGKTIYENYIPLDSKVETDFAKDCESSENIEFYFKLPFWFKINTPIGKYNPDWAIVFKGKKKIYFVAETKGDGQELRGSEKMKIKCGEEHFRNFEEVVYKRVSKVSELDR